jgi:hypothetical protein
MNSRFAMAYCAGTDILGGATGLNYASDYRDVDGISVPTKRRVYAYEGDYISNDLCLQLLFAGPPVSSSCCIHAFMLRARVILREEVLK